MNEWYNDAVWKRTLLVILIPVWGPIFILGAIATLIGWVMADTIAQAVNYVCFGHTSYIET